MRRAAHERSRTLRTWKRHLARVHRGLPTTCPCERQPGRFRKGERVGGCSRTRCFLCKAPKLSGEPTLQQRRAAHSGREWLRELDRSRS